MPPCRVKCLATKPERSWNDLGGTELQLRIKRYPEQSEGKRRGDDEIMQIEEAPKESWAAIPKETFHTLRASMPAIVAACNVVGGWHLNTSWLSKYQKTTSLHILKPRFRGTRHAIFLMNFYFPNKFTGIGIKW